jgi:hypothetical protein
MNVIVPARPLKEPVVLNPRFFILNEISDALSTGASDWAHRLMLINRVRMDAVTYFI